MGLFFYCFNKYVFGRERGGTKSGCNGFLTEQHGTTTRVNLTQKHGKKHGILKSTFY
jgi:hypothetical protein